LKDDFLIAVSYTSLFKPAYVWPTQSTQSVKTVVYLRKLCHKNPVIFIIRLFSTSTFRVPKSQSIITTAPHQS